MSVENKDTSSSEEGVILSPDEVHLAQLGYKQEVSVSVIRRLPKAAYEFFVSQFKRQFSKIELFGVAFSIIGVVPSIA